MKQPPPTGAYSQAVEATLLHELGRLGPAADKAGLLAGVLINERRRLAARITRRKGRRIIATLSPANLINQPEGEICP